MNETRHTRETKPDGTFVKKTHHTKTKAGRAIDGKLLKCECEGGSDYCCHCGNEPGGFCDVLNRLAYGAPDQDGVVAYGCRREIPGKREACSVWCASDNCPVSRGTHQ